MIECLFLGTGGARYVVARQLRASGGILLKSISGPKTYLLLLDPGPGALIQLAKQKIYPEKISYLLVTHKHLDHSADLNILADAITEGGFKKRGTLFITDEALREGILLNYLRDCLKEIVILKERKKYEVDGFSFCTTGPLLHNAEIYGIIFHLPSKRKIGIIGDTAFFEGLIEEFIGCDYLIVNLVRYEPKKEVLHLSVPDLKGLLKSLNPKLTIITHFGMTMLKAGPERLAKALSEELGLKVISAYDGMRYLFE